jgi:phage terminase large subunit
MDLKLNTNGNEKQKECARMWIDDTVTDVAYGGGKGGGKSYIGCSLIGGDALMYPDTFYFVARKKLSDLRKFTIPSFHEVFKNFGIHEKYFKFNGQDNYFEFYNKSRIYLLDAKFIPSDPMYTRFGSMQMTRGWIEEAGEFELECKNNLQASIGRYNNIKYKLKSKLLMTCNPAKNFLYSDYYKPHFEGKLHGTHKRFIQALPSDNKMLPPDYVDGLMKILSPNEIQRLIYGNWEFDDNPYSLFDYTDILGVFTNEFVLPTEERFMSCDISYTGSDKFVIILWAGMVVKKIIAIDKIDDTMVSKKIHELRLEYNIPIRNVIYDADGLQTFTRFSAKFGNLSGAKGFNNGGVPVKVSGKSENYKNLKAQCYFAMANAVKNNELFIEDKTYRKQVIEELEQINRMPLNDDGKIAMEKKEDVRKRFGRSPDFADALMMRFYFELKGIKRVSIVW